ncbi:MAG: DUF373 family protein [Candidatus Thermoplasmatota archaeon]|nr:DUF373 family protein [Candidatus Thermoplasmatota archaeon]MBS3789343.1 DUF373 family protein [Candidatus Thermoplasmatota archaeon]
MRKLILCADRDDDIGEKTGLETPIIGREENLQAAVKLGLKDPEDSDTNSILSAISIYDDLKENGEDVEIATICGASSIGYTSDTALGEELDYVLEKTSADSAILVTDGAEDEYISPIISSKIDISHIRTVYVKQSESVENLYYLFVKTFQEEKSKRKFLLPISLALLVYGFFRIIALLSNLFIEGVGALTGLPGFGVGIIFFVIGGYIFTRIYELDRKTVEVYKNLREAVTSGSVWLPFTAVSVLIVIGSSLQGWSEVVANENLTSPLEIALRFSSTVIWWWIGAVFLHELGRLIDTYIKKGRVKWSFWAVFLTLFALTFIFWGALDYIMGIVGMEEEAAFPMVAINITLGLLIGVLAGLTQRSFRERQKREEKAGTEEITD